MEACANAPSPIENGVSMCFDDGFVVYTLMGQKTLMNSTPYFQAMEVGRPEVAVCGLRDQASVETWLLRPGFTGCCAVYGWLSWRCWPVFPDPIFGSVVR